MMNTLLVVPWESRGGVVTAAENLARYLQTRGHRVLFFHPGSAMVLKMRTTGAGFCGAQMRLPFPFATPRRVVNTLLFPFLFPIMLVQLMCFLCREDIDIVNIHYPRDNFFYFGICAHLLSIRLVTSLHGGDAFQKGRPKNRYSLLFRFLTNSSDLIILPSHTYREKLLEAFPGFKNKTISIHNGVNPAQFTVPEGARDRKATGRYILCIADHREYKGIDVLLHASKPLLTSNPSLSLVLAGDGPLRVELESLALSLGIRNQAKFLGMKGTAEIVSLLHGCEMLVLPSREESFGIVLIEAMVCKKPVVATAVGGIPEIIEHGKTGILVQPDNPLALAEAMRNVLTNIDLNRALGEKGYSRVIERFRFDHTGAAYETAFASLLNRPRPSLSSAT